MKRLTHSALDVNYGAIREARRVRGNRERRAKLAYDAYSEKARAAEESAQGERQTGASEPAAAPEPQPTAKPTRTRQRRPKVETMPAPAEIAIHGEAQQGTGTYGPAPKILTAPIPARLPAMARPGRVPYNVAFREIVGFVISELKASGEQWTDQSRQGLVSTVIISASRQGLLDIWERPQ
ncbi:MAG TPA: hypothetical protein VMQ76_11700 [Terracidiphilus sp.]|nr:hypothetical protein [Terracidiphilus sp.]